MPRGAPGRLSTAYGSLESAHDQYQAAVREEEATRKPIKAKEARRLAKLASDERKQPILNLFCSAGYLKEGEKLVKTKFTEMFSRNSNLLSELGLCSSS